MALNIYLTPKYRSVHLSACNRKGFEVVAADLSKVIVTQAPTGYFEVVGEFIKDREVAFTNIKRVYYQTDKVILGQPKFEWVHAPSKIRARIGAFELDVTRCSE